MYWDTKSNIFYLDNQVLMTTCGQVGRMRQQYNACSLHFLSFTSPSLSTFLSSLQLMLKEKKAKKSDVFLDEFLKELSN